MNDKKALIKQYKNTVQPMGIYRISNKVNGKIFIGSSKTVNSIWNRISFQLQNGSSHLRELQQDFNQYGSEVISFEIIDYLEPKQEPGYDYNDDLQALLELWLAKEQPYESRGYNKRI